MSRFINADAAVVLCVSSDLYDKNLFAYCDNNPIVRVDVTGYVWETVFDVASLAFSAVEVCVNPTDFSAWIGLMGDTVDLIPFVTGVGETIRTLRTAEKVMDGADATIDTHRNLRKNSKGTGKEVHHILEKRFLKQLDLNYAGPQDMLGIILTKNQHAKYTKVFREILPYGKNYTEDQIIRAAAEADSNDSQLMGTILYSLLKRK